MQTQKQVRTVYGMIAKTGAEFPLKVSTKRFSQNYCFQESGWLLFPGSSPNYWTHWFPMKAFRENYSFGIEEAKAARLCYRGLIIAHFQQALVEHQMTEILTIFQSSYDAENNNSNASNMNWLGFELSSKWKIWLSENVFFSSGFIWRLPLLTEEKKGWQKNIYTNFKLISLVYNKNNLIVLTDRAPRHLHLQRYSYRWRNNSITTVCSFRKYGRVPDLVNVENMECMDWSDKKRFGRLQS